MVTGGMLYPYIKNQSWIPFCVYQTVIQDVSDIFVLILVLNTEDIFLLDVEFLELVLQLRTYIEYLQYNQFDRLYHLKVGKIFPYESKITPT